MKDILLPKGFVKLPDIYSIIAIDNKYRIGRGNELPWKLSSDLKRFKELTMNGVCIVGRTTMETLGNKPLPNRMFVVVTSKPELYEGIENVKTASSVKEAIKVSYNNWPEKDIHICGGVEIYKEGFYYSNYIICTDVECDDPIEKDDVIFNDFINVIRSMSSKVKNINIEVADKDDKNEFKSYVSLIVNGLIKHPFEYDKKDGKSKVIYKGSLYYN